MLNLLLQAMRSSEFWTALGLAIGEVVSAPVPEEMKGFGWAYVILRVLGKVAKFVIPAPKA